MGLTNAIGNALKSSTGNITKAFLVVRNPAKVWERDSSGKLVKLDYDSAKVAQAEAKNIYNNIKKGQKDRSRISAKNFSEGPDAEYLMIEVQYNPSSVQLSSQYGKYIDYNGGIMGASSGSASVMRDTPMKHDLSTRLILDAVDPDDCFDASFNTSVTALAKNAISAVSRLNGNERTVKDKVDLLLALNLHKQLQDMYFVYGKTVFHGFLTSVNANYTMFNMDGNPVRAVVDITMTQANAADLAYRYDTMEWNAKYRYFIQEHTNNVNKS